VLKAIPDTTNQSKADGDEDTRGNTDGELAHAYMEGEDDDDVTQSRGHVLAPLSSPASQSNGDTECNTDKTGLNSPDENDKVDNAQHNSPDEVETADNTRHKSPDKVETADNTRHKSTDEDDRVRTTHHNSPDEDDTLDNTLHNPSDEDETVDTTSRKSSDEVDTVDHDRNCLSLRPDDDRQFESTKSNDNTNALCKQCMRARVAMATQSRTGDPRIMYICRVKDTSRDVTNSPIELSQMVCIKPLGIPPSGPAIPTGPPNPPVYAPALPPPKHPVHKMEDGDIVPDYIKLHYLD
jgi:hypothetical protein